MSSQYVFEAIGTHWVIDVYTYIPPDTEHSLLEIIKNRIDVFDKNYSRFRLDSLVTKISKKSGSFDMPEDSIPLFSLYKTLYTDTSGALTPLIGQVMVQAGYDAQYSLTPKEITKPPLWDDAFIFDESTHPPRITTKNPILIDIGALGKGYLVDIIGELLEKNGVYSYCIDAGGDIMHRNTAESLKIGLEHPENFEQVIGIAHIQNQSLCGSAGNRRVWASFHHIINPHTLSSPRHILATWVLAQTTLLADGLATALFFTTPDTLMHHFDFEYVIVYANKEVKMSKRFPGELF